VNNPCLSLTDQVRSITIVTIAVARGDLTQKIENQVESVIPTLKGTSSLSFWESNLGINICTPRYRKPYGGSTRTGGDKSRLGGQHAGYSR
jgi:hypothetical protein